MPAMLVAVPSAFQAEPFVDQWDSKAFPVRVE
jgi:hypothetical protein